MEYSLRQTINMFRTYLLNTRTRLSKLVSQWKLEEWRQHGVNTLGEKVTERGIEKRWGRVDVNDRKRGRLDMGRGDRYK